MKPFTQFKTDHLYNAAADVLFNEGVEEIKKKVAELKVGSVTNFGVVKKINDSSVEFKARDTGITKIAFNQRKMGSKDFVLDKLIVIKEELELDETELDEATKYQTQLYASWKTMSAAQLNAERNKLVKHRDGLSGSSDKELVSADIKHIDSLLSKKNESVDELDEAKGADPKKLRELIYNHTQLLAHAPDAKAKEFHKVAIANAKEKLKALGEETEEDTLDEVALPTELAKVRASIKGFEDKLDTHPASSEDLKKIIAKLKAREAILKKQLGVKEETELEEALLVTKVEPSVKKIIDKVNELKDDEFENLLFNLAIYADKKSDELADAPSFGFAAKMDIVYKNLIAAATAWKKRPTYKVEEETELDEGKADYVSVRNLKLWFKSLSISQNAVAKASGELDAMIKRGDQFNYYQSPSPTIDSHSKKIIAAIKTIIDIHDELLKVGKINKSLQLVYIDVLEENIEYLEARLASGKDSNNYVIKSQIKDRKEAVAKAKADLKDLPTTVAEDVEELDEGV